MKLATLLTHGLALLGAASLSVGASAALADETPNPEQLEQRIDDMQRQLDELKQQLKQMRAQNEALAAAQQQQALQPVAQEAGPSGARPASGGISENLSLWGYGELYYTHPVHDGECTQFDLARAVFGIGYRFDELTVFNSEYEVEHAVASAEDRGEFEVEQFFIDRQLASWVAVKGGLFLMPFGLLNEHHEPTNFYGVQRNFVETLIIPSTWREGGVGVHGNTGIGLGWDAGLTTGFNLNGWQVNPENPQYRTALELEDNAVAPLQATHQEAQLANAHHLAEYVALNYSGIPALLAGGALFTGEAGIPSFPAGLPNERVTLYEGHARFSSGGAELTALYARGRISNTATFNLDNTGAANPLPAEFLGYYAQAAYALFDRHGYRLAPFVRFEHYDMGARYEGIRFGFTPLPQGRAADGEPWPQPRDQVWTLGANLYLDPHVVLKADYQSFHNNPDFTRFDLGLGLNF